MELTRYRTFWRRFFAAFVDGFVLLPLVVVAEAIRRSGAEDSLLLAGALTSGVGFLYSVLMHARFGQTVGKMVTGVKVLDLTESRIPTLRQAFRRDIGWIVLEVASLMVLADRLSEGLPGHGGSNDYLDWASTVWFLLEIVTMLTNSKRRAFHDFIARTVVVRVRS